MASSDSQDFDTYQLGELTPKLERVQDDVLRQLTELNERIEMAVEMAQRALRSDSEVEPTR